MVSRNASKSFTNISKSVQYPREISLRKFYVNRYKVP
jgi:hypothetical protein